MLFVFFISHFFLFFSLLLLLICNSLVVRSRRTYHRILCDEIFAQTFTVCVIVLVLIINSKAEGFSTDYNLVFNLGKVIIQVISVLFMLFSLPSVTLSFRSQNLNFFEFFVILLVILISIFFIINSNSLIILFIAVEIFALCSIILSAFNKLSAFSTEAGLKYFISSAIFSGIFLLGSGLLYFCYGTVHFDKILSLTIKNSAEFNSSLCLMIEIGMFLILAWLLFKITSAPFQFLVAEIYDGAPLATTIFLSIVPKFALVVFLLRWLQIFFALDAVSTGYFILDFFGIISCVFGFISALKQKKLKKLFIFSSIGQVGFITIASSLIIKDGAVSVIAFLLVYILTSIIVWNLIAVFFACEIKININRSVKVYPFNLTQLSGLYYKDRTLAIFISVIVFSLSAIPPLLGFYGKFEIFSAIVNDNLFFPIVILVLLSSMSTFYYIDMIRSSFFEGDQNRIKVKDDFIVTSCNDYFIYCITYINCFLIIVLIFGIFYPEMLINIASLIAYYNNL